MGYYNDLTLGDTHTTDDEWYDRVEGSGGALPNLLARVQASREMNTFIISEIVEVKMNGAWYEAEILDITGRYAYVYIFETGCKVNVNLTNVR